MQEYLDELWNLRARLLHLVSASADDRGMRDELREVILQVAVAIGLMAPTSPVPVLH